MAAGLGTRMRSRQAKLLHPLTGLPLIRYPLRAVSALDADPVVVVIGHQADEMMAACGEHSVRFAHQSQQHGTGHAAQCAAEVLTDFTGDVLILYGDLPLLTSEALASLVAAHRGAGAVLSLLTATIDDAHGFGRIIREHGRVVGIVEERDANAAQRAIREVNVGVYCVASSFLFPALKRLRSNNAQGELYLTDIVGQAAAQGSVIADAPVAEAEVAQVNSRVELANVERALRQRITHRWMTDGVTLDDPDTTYIGPDVMIGHDTVIGPNVILRGSTQIGDACRIDGSDLIVDSVIDNAVHVKFGVVITESHIGAGCQIGPFAQLRPGTHLAANVHIGDFVETKNAVIGSGTKANHLAYIGDAEIGRDSNVGAGAITCNYDGVRKHRTVIGARVQIGSDSQLIAPVTIGDDAYIATGTTVMQDVPAGALAFTVKRQEHRPGWVATRHARETKAGPATPAKKTKSTTKRRAVPKLRARTAAAKKRRSR
ncbi:MAG: bifunctional UDP-N-acetylglucosamine diphosphorylase/glucosamine-1-phosphate N-acetyltransferase GlmU [Deltaproteobacteria bacterium]|nr:bifunctional UDP-N-acetylglucosamine diphosphorylase/glucosamine-1-phosphate N-acetyltransferase GlmU [Deltaproteobacteria bacterium]MBI3387479.1 bifunctional UDP-N-acetylglucosamine diphosphorylase/glucosamine-1-phosphate N-acetyltransferase GlmU [Deltaproteobacteria bacterium]